VQPQSHHDSPYRFFTVPSASVQIRVASSSQGGPELQIFGNRAGLLSLANVLLWFIANASRREFLSLGDLPFVHEAGSRSIHIRLTMEDGTGHHGSLCRKDKREQLEWTISEDDLQQVALLMHRLTSVPEHEYDRLEMSADSDAGIQVRMTDATEWIQTERA
jgi:hypothetical protein